MGTLVERLRAFPDNVLEGAPLCEEAADLITAQQRTIELQGNEVRSLQSRVDWLGRRVGLLWTIERRARDVLDWSWEDNDDDAVQDIEELREAVRDYEAHSRTEAAALSAQRGGE